MRHFQNRMKNSNDRNIRQLVYMSRLHDWLDVDEAASQIGLESAPRNRELKITGLFLINSRDVFQLIEGPYNSIDMVYGKIKNDARHHSVTLLSDINVDERVCDNWWIAAFDPNLPLSPVGRHFCDLIEEACRRHKNNSGIVRAVSSELEGLLKSSVEIMKVPRHASPAQGMESA